MSDGIQTCLSSNIAYISTMEPTCFCYDFVRTRSLFSNYLYLRGHFSYYLESFLRICNALPHSSLSPRRSTDQRRAPRCGHSLSEHQLTLMGRLLVPKTHECAHTIFQPLGQRAHSHKVHSQTHQRSRAQTKCRSRCWEDRSSIPKCRAIEEAPGVSL